MPERMGTDGKTVNHSPSASARPERVTVKPLDGAVLVTWDRPAASNVTHFELTPCYGSIWLAERAVTVDGSSSSGVVRELLNSVTYVIRVTPYFDDVPGPAAVSSSFEPNPAPGAPSYVVAIAGEQSATVTWLPPAGGGRIDEYRILASPPHVDPRSVPSTQTSALVNGLRNRSRYSFTVAAANSAGEGVSAPSNTIWPGDDVPRYLFPLALGSLIFLGVIAFLYSLHYPPVTVTLSSLGQFRVPALRDALPPVVAGVPISIPWFGAMGAVLTGLYGIFDHAHRDWERRFNAWYVARPLTGAALAAVAYIVFLATIRATGLYPVTQDSVGKLIYFMVAFIVGFREETFRMLIARVGDLIVGPGLGRISVFAMPDRQAAAPRPASPAGAQATAGLQPTATTRPAESR